MSSAFRQCFFVPKPELTEQNVPDQTGKVHIVTGGYAGCGFELTQILYGHANATVYVAGRNAEKAHAAIAKLRSAHPDSKGKLEFMQLDLSDLKTIKPAVDSFLEKETRLDVLTNNAGISMIPKGLRDAQGHELIMGTNCLGPFLLTELLKPILAETAKSAEPGSVRVTWASSIAADLMTPKPGGIEFDEGEEGKPKESYVGMNYAQSKAGNVLLAGEAIRRWGEADRVVHVAWNPGNLKTELMRYSSYRVTARPFLHPAIYGGYTELFAAVSPSITLENNGVYIIPWGRLGRNRPDLHDAANAKEEGTGGTAAKFWNWCEKVTSEFR